MKPFVIHTITYLAFTAVGLILGLGWQSRPARRSLCRSCHHGVGFHEDKTGRCHADDNVYEDPNDVCNCRHYDGPHEVLRSEVAS